jgi:hypothetical protein
MIVELLNAEHNNDRMPPHSIVITKHPSALMITRCRGSRRP